MGLLTGYFSAYIYVLFSGHFSIKDVVPSKEGESSKVKVKVRLDIHGILNVVNASLVEKLAVAQEPEVESMEVEGQDEKAQQTTGDAASEVQERIFFNPVVHLFEAS